MDVWIAQAECGDYYCGCGGGHLIGIYSTEKAANNALIAAASMTQPLKRVDGSIVDYKSYSIYLKEGTTEVVFGGGIEKIEVDAEPSTRNLNI